MFLTDHRRVGVWHGTPSALSFAVTLGALLTWASPARAAVDPARALEHLGDAAFERLTAVPLTAPGGDVRVPVLIQHPQRWLALPHVVSVAPHHATAWLTKEELRALALAQPELRMEWSPPRRLMLDRAARWTRAAQFRVETGGAGAGAVVGVVDTGLDVAHGDFRRLDGTTRVAWLLDYSRPPAGLQPELEARYGCTAVTPCAIYSGADLDAALQGGLSLPRDVHGHGTHVASLAAGNGFASDPSRFIGVAPSAPLIIVRGDRAATGSFQDADIITGAAFVFERAEAMGLPAVVNLSLGSDFGAHDGSSSLEQGLAALVGDELPGRALVVAAGNSGGLYYGAVPSYPEPLGVHTEVHVPRKSSARVPILTPAPAAFELTGRVYVWITARPGDALEVGLDDRDGEWVPPLTPGQASTFRRQGLSATVFNGLTEDGPLTQPHTAVLVLDGKWSAEQTFALRLEGHGSASIWLESSGELPGGARLEALLPRAIKQGTVSLPAAHPELIAVGASINRTDWSSRAGEMRLTHLGAAPATLDGMAYFSGAGPTADGALKPDLVAPGAFLVGAMSSWADPARPNASGMFSGAGLCEAGAECLVVGDAHAVTSGTSMAAPQVAGAVALLLERDPSLTQRQVRGLLQAGARRLQGSAPIAEQVGVGALDVMGALEAQLLQEGAPGDVSEPDPERSWLTLASAFVYPDPALSVEVYAELRTASGRLADALEPGALTLSVTGGRLAAPLTRIAPGLWRARVSADAERGGEQLRLKLTHGEREIATHRAPIAVDPHLAVHPPWARGGCAVEPAHRRAARGSGAALGALLVLSALGAFTRRRRGRARTHGARRA